MLHMNVLESCVIVGEEEFNFWKGVASVKGKVVWLEEKIVDVEEMNVSRYCNESDDKS